MEHIYGTIYKLKKRLENKPINKLKLSAIKLCEYKNISFYECCITSKLNSLILHNSPFFDLKSIMQEG